MLDRCPVECFCHSQLYKVVLLILVSCFYYYDLILPELIEHVPTFLLQACRTKKQKERKGKGRKEVEDEKKVERG